MPNKYSGLALGGPHDGKQIEASNHIYRVPVRQAAPTFFEEDGLVASTAAPVEAFLYHYVELAEGLAVWVPGEYCTYPYAYAFEKLLTNYRPIITT